MERLLEIIASLDSVAVALSGGVDSAVVAMAAHKALGAKAVAVTADSPSVARSDLESAKRVAQFIGIRHVILTTSEFDNPAYVVNDGSRCYHCKSELYSQILARKSVLEVNAVVSGANLDDSGDYRPGLVAAAENGIRHPLQEAGFTKADVRALARQWGLPVWDKPASPCLASRLAPGVAVTPERTQRVEQAEALLRRLGFTDGRVRYHDGDLARIEVPRESIGRFFEGNLREIVEREFLSLGFRYITVDLMGFRSGSLNELVPLTVKATYARKAVTA